MFKVFIPAKVLANIYLEESSRKNSRNQSNWFRILMKQNTIYTIGYKLPDSAPSDDDASDEAVLWDFCRRYDIAIVPRDNYLQSIKDMPQTVLEQPCGVFYLDITPQEARDIQNKYGVICQSTSRPFNAKVLATAPEVYDFPKYKNAPQWKTIFEIPNYAPSNAICIIDRNLFAYDGQINTHTQRENSSGVYNVYFILDSALPKHLSVPYHVTIFCECLPLKVRDPITKKEEVVRSAEDQFNTIANTIFEEINMLNRDFQIEAEIIAFKKGKRFYNEVTHNRQIFSNYYRIGAENGLNATNFVGNHNQGSTYSQQLNAHLLYSTGLRRGGTYCTADTNNRLEIDCASFIDYWRRNADSNDYLYASNNETASFLTHKNRLFQ